MINNSKDFNFYGYLEGWLSIFINGLLFALKFWAGTVTGSVAIIVDAWHSLSDSLTSVVVIVGVKISSKPADREHPFGHGRAELIGSIIIGVLLFFVACNFIIESVLKLKNHEPVEYGTIAIVAIVVSILSKEVLAQFSIWAGKKVNSKALIADGWHHRSDSITSVLILIGIFVGKHFWWMDGVLGILVSLVLVYVTYEILRDTVSSLIGEEPGEELVKKINSLAREVYDGDIQLHHIHCHSYGLHTEMTFHIKLPAKMHLDEAHEIASRLENMIWQKHRIDVTTHIEPENPLPGN